jgi:WD40 repeat protein
VQAADGTVTVWSLPAFRVLGRVTGAGRASGPNPLAVAADGATVAIIDGSDRSRLAVYPTRGGRPTSLPAQPQGTSVTAFSPDGRELAVGSSSGPINVYGAATGALNEAFSGESGQPLGLAWSGVQQPTGLYSGGLDSQLVSWSVRSGPRLISQAGAALHAPDRGELFGSVALGMTPAEAPAVSERGYALDIRTGHISTWPLGLPANGYLNQLVASHDGRIALESTEDPAGHNTVIVRDLARNRDVGSLHLPADTSDIFGPGFNAAVSPDGATAYVNLGSSRIGVFAVPSGKYLRSFTIRYSGTDGARVIAIPWQFDPSGRLIFGGADTGPHPNNVPSGGIGPNDTNPPDQRLGLVDVRSGRLIAQAGLGDISGPTALAWSPDRRTLAVGTYDGTLTLYDARTLRPVAAAGPIEPGAVRTVSFSPDGADLITAGTGGQIRFWSVPGLTSEGNPIRVGSGGNDGGVFAWYTPSGQVVGLGADDRSPGTDWQRWFDFRAAPADLLRTACALAGTDMTRAQWRRYVPDESYRHVC